MVQKSVEDAEAAQLVMADLQKNLLLAAPWSATIEQEVAKSEAKGELALAQVRALHDATKAEVEDLRRRATEVEKKVPETRKRNRGSQGRKIWSQISFTAKKRRGPNSKRT